jgi:ubiquinone/menaquinone biosynthesis C-methylase UbiE
MKQNIYDNPVFFENYKDLRDNDKGLNGAVELPALRQLINTVENSTVLDLGCGLGHQIQYLLEHKAKEIIGVDISENMIAEAKKRIRSKKVLFFCQAIEDFKIEKETFDIILSSMTLHYIKPAFND